MNKKGILGALWVALLVMATPAAAERIAYVDIAEIFDQYEGTVTAKEKLKQEAEKEKKQLEKTQEKLASDIEALRSKKSVMTEKKYQEEENELRGKTQKLQAEIQQIQEALIAKEKTLTKNILEEIKAIVAEVAEDEKYDFILEKNAVLFGGKEITYKVIKAMNKK